MDAARSGRPRWRDRSRARVANGYWRAITAGERRRARNKAPCQQHARGNVIRNGLMAAAAAATLAVAGCGGGDDNKALSYSDFSQQANDICKQANADTAALQQKFT